MNCKPGDLAIVVLNSDGNLGKLLHVMRPFKLAGWWICQPLCTFRTADIGDTRGLVAAADAALRPIRDPGDGASDETLDWLPVPTKETA